MRALAYDAMDAEVRPWQTEYDRLAVLRDEIERTLVIAKQTVALCEGQREAVHAAIGNLIGVPTDLHAQPKEGK